MPKPTIKKTDAQEVRERMWQRGLDEMLPFFGGANSLPNLGNLTPSAICDSIGYLKQLEKDAKKVMGTLQGIFDTKVNLKEGEVSRGDRFYCEIRDGRQQRLVAELARTELIRLAQKCGEEPEAVLRSVTKEVGEWTHYFKEI